MLRRLQPLRTRRPAPAGRSRDAAIAAVPQSKHDFLPTKAGMSGKGLYAVVRWFAHRAAVGGVYRNRPAICRFRNATVRNYHGRIAKPLACPCSPTDLNGYQALMNSISSFRPASRRLGRGLMLAGAAAVFALAGISTASAQATTGTVFGKAPAGYSITVRSTSNGSGRTVTVDSMGRYYAPSLGLGTYKVTLKQNGQAIAEHPDVPVTVGRGVEVDFDCSKINCGEVADAK